MDHLLLSSEPTLPPITVPLITTLPTSPLGDFHTFPDRSHFRQILETSFPDLSTSSSKSMGPLVQKWLFSNLIESVTRSAQPYDFVRALPNDEGHVITTSKLYERIEGLFDSYIHSEKEAAIEHYQYANGCLFEAYGTLKRLRDYRNDKHRLDENVHLSIAVLLNSYNMWTGSSG